MGHGSRTVCGFLACQKCISCGLDLIERFEAILCQTFDSEQLHSIAKMPGSHQLAFHFWQPCLGWLEEVMENSIMQKHDYKFGPSQPKRPPENCLKQKHDYSVGPRPPRRPPECFVMEKHDYEVGPRPQPDKPAWKRVQVAEEDEEQEEKDESAAHMWT